MADEAWLESVAMRPMLEALLEAVCKDKPDVMLAYAIQWLRESYPDQAEAAFTHSPSAWAPRADVDPSPEGLMAYLKEVEATDFLEGILERAIRAQPSNVVAFVIDECAALLTGVSQVAGGSGVVGSYVGRMADAAVQGSTPHPDTPALFEAVSDGDVDLVRQLLSEVGVPADAHEAKTHATALLSAAEGQEECLAELLAAGATVDAQNMLGETALMKAVKYADAECIRMLLDARADPGLRDVGGKSALDLAVEADEPELLALLDPTGTLAAPVPPPPAPPKPSRRRGSVSSESIDPTAEVDLASTPRYEKAPEVSSRLEELLDGSFLFRALDRETRGALVLSMVERQHAAGETVITQGEAGDFFYICDAGHLDCFVSAEGEGFPGRQVTEYGPGATFGELALMYNCPRKASIIARTDVTLFGIERDVFRTLVLAKYMAQRMRFEEILATIPLLQSMDSYERAALADGFDELSFPAGARVLTEGEFGQTFYVLLDGTAVATQADANGVEHSIKSYASGDYFGELALLRNEARAASVLAETECKCIVLDKRSFERLLGPVRTILARDASNYAKHI